jgi:hypothetical protein
MKGRIGELVYMAEDYADSMVEEGADFHDAYTEVLTHSIIEECIRVLQKRYMGDNNREDMEVKRCIEALQKHWS